MTDSKVTKVLLIDDSIFFLSQMSDLLTEANYETLLCKSGQEAMKIMADQQNELDLIITDLQMPDLDGFKLVTWLRAQPYGADIPVMVLTGAFDLGEVVDSLKNLGVSSILDKGSHPHHILLRINDVLFPDLENQRKHTRVYAHLPVVFFHNEWMKTGVITNISLGGCFIDTRNVVPTDSHISVAINLPGREEDITLSGLVVWELGGKDWKGKPPTLQGIGVKWLEINNSDRLLLDVYIGEKLKEERLYDMLMI